MSAGQISGGDDISALVIDTGSRNVRFGFSGNDTPTLTIPSVVGAQSSGTETSNFVGDTELLYPHKHMDIERPVTNGVIQNVEKVCEIYSYGLNRLTGRRNADLSELRVSHPILMIDPIVCPSAVRAELVEYLFETLDCPAVYFAHSAVTACYASARYTGLVLESGAGYTAAVPIHEGYALHNHVVSSPIAGDVITGILDSKLNDKHVDLLSPYQYFKRGSSVTHRHLPGITDSYHAFRRAMLVEDIKESICDVPDVPMDDSTDPTPPESYSLPDGSTVTLGTERLTVPEVLFNPTMLDTTAGRNNNPAVQGMVVSSIASCDESIQRDLFQNILPVGGSTAFPQFVRRLTSEIDTMKLPVFKTKVHSYNPAERGQAAWTGGSILSSLGTFHQLWLDRAEFLEHGKGVANTKFL
ncbi:Actin-related protein [Carpediemonas membranifera]|uniref:Actin-related protein n=1 Tax=Carpediemonas membranifera TaxID=201153 RepID=A0A8J6E469_9EUKA|nr:Actin-related protein [Carpediemonas membranifera]|eukprot:KAG9394087.1 Actin-related protein [Carpediemonas membranifera]